MRRRLSGRRGVARGAFSSFLSRLFFSFIASAAGARRSPQAALRRRRGRRRHTQQRSLGRRWRLRRRWQSRRRWAPSHEGGRRRAAEGGAAGFPGVEAGGGRASGTGRIAGARGGASGPSCTGVVCCFYLTPGSRRERERDVRGVGPPVVTKLKHWGSFRAESEMSIYIIQGDPWRPVVEPVENVRASGATSTSGRASGPEQRGRVEAMSLGHAIIELLGDAAILTSEVVRIVRRCRPKKVRQRGKGNESEDG